MRKVTGKKYFNSIYNYERMVGQPYGSGLNRPNTVSSNSRELNQFTQYYNPQLLTDSRSWWDEFMISLDPVSSWNLFHENRLKSKVTSAEHELSEINDNIDKLKGVQEYIDDVTKLNELYEQRDEIYREYDEFDSLPHVGLKRVEEKNAEIAELTKKVEEAAQKYKRDYKTSGMMIDLFFDPDKAEMTSDEVTWNLGLGNYQSGFNPLDALSETWQKAKELWKAGEDGLSKILPDWMGTHPNGNFTRRFIRKMSDPRDGSTDKWFESYLGDESDYIGSIMRGNRSVSAALLSRKPKIERLQAKVEDYWKYWQKERRAAEYDVKDNLDALLNGTWMFDPKGIDPKFREVQEGKSYGIFGVLNPANLMYSFSELGSSFGSVQHMVGSIALDALISKAVGFAATKLNPYTASLFMAKDAFEAMSALLKVQQLEKAASFAKNVNYIGGAVSVGSNIYFTNQMRRWETNSEAMDAYSNRVLNTAMDQQLNLNRIYKNTDLYLANIGINTEGLNQIDKILLALAFNAPSGDEQFERIKTDARKGLAEVINKNNALAFMDYIEALPFMNYTKSFLRSFGSRGFRNGSKKYAQEWIENDRLLREAVDPSVGAWIHHKVELGITKYIKNPKNQLRLSHGSKFFTRKASQLLPLMEKERIEEGVQHLLQTRYARGEFDDYNEPTSMFDIPSLVDNTQLAAEAIASYWGINSGDPDNGSEELQKAMDIGGITAMWFRAPHALTNILSNKTNERLSKYTLGILGDELHDNIRNLLSQFKYDKMIAKIVGDNYGKLEDDEHIGIFFDAIDKGKADINKLSASLEDFKKFKGLGVTNDFINRDLQLLNSTWNIYHSPVDLAFLKSQNIELGSEAHKKHVQLAVSSLYDSLRVNSIHTKDVEKYELAKELFIQKALGMLNMLSKDVFTDTADIELYNIVQQIKELFSATQDTAIKLFNDYSASKEARKLAIVALEESGVEPAAGGKDDTIANYSEEQILEKIKETGEELFGINHTVDDAVRAAIENVLAYHLMQASKNVTNLFKNQSKFIDLVNKEFGVDIPYDRLLGMIHVLNKDLQDRFEKFNLSLKVQRKLQNQEDVSDEQLLNPFGIQIPSEIIQQYPVLLINRSINQVLNASANAYTLGAANPNLLRLTHRRPSWNQLTKELKDNYSASYKSEKGNENASEKQIIAMYNKERRDYYREMDNLRKEYNKIVDPNKKPQDYDEETLKKILEIEKTAAEKFMLSELIIKTDRKKIAHDEFLNDRPVTYDDFQEARSGNEKALQKIDNTPKEEEKKPVLQNLQPSEKPSMLNLNIPADSPVAMSDDEKALRQAFGLDLEDESDIYELHLKTDRDNDEYDVQMSEEETRRRSGRDGENLQTNSKDLLETFNVSEHDSSASLNDTYSGADKSKTKQYTANKDEIEFNYVDQTFFFANYAETPPDLKINGKNVVLLDGATLRSGKELAEKLLQPGWFYSTKKYYVVTGDTETERTEDQLTVCMIILDGKNAYATFLKRPFEKDNRVNWSERRVTLSEKLRYQNISDEYVGNSEEAVALRGVAFKKALESVYRRENPDKVIPDTTEEKNKVLSDWYATTSQENRDDISDIWRKAAAKGRSIHTERHITKQLEELRQARSTIINACVSKDNNGRYVLLTEGYKIVEPLYSDISNGKITVQYSENGKDHEYRNLTDGGFGMSSDIVELSDQIAKDEVQIGVGVGLSVDNKEDAYSIVHVDKKKTGSWDPHVGTGYAGKVYVIVKAANGNPVPVMIPESRFKQEYDDQARQQLGDNYSPDYEVLPEMIEEAIDENGNIKEGKVPTVAELVFRLITRSMNINQFGNNIDEELLDELLSLLVNHGEDTVPDSDYKKDESYIRKTLWFDERRTLHIALRSDYTGKWQITKIPRSYFFEDSEKATASAEQNRKRVIAAIATNLHWNTDRESLMDDMYSQYRALFEYLKKLFKQDPSKTEVSVLGIKDLTFGRDELFDENFKPKHFSHLAWMFTNGKLKTDAIPTIFKDPFVFAREVKPVSESELAKYQAKVAELNVANLEKQKEKLTDKLEENKEKDKSKQKSSATRQKLSKRENGGEIDHKDGDVTTKVSEKDGVRVTKYTQYRKTKTGIVKPIRVNGGLIIDSSTITEDTLPDAELYDEIRLSELIERDGKYAGTVFAKDSNGWVKFEVTFKRNPTIKQVDNLQKQEKQSDSELSEPTNPNLFSVAVNNIINRMKKYSGMATKKFKEHLESMLGMAKEEARALLDEAGFEDAAILDVPVFYNINAEEQNPTDEKLRSEMDAAIKRYVDQYNKTHEQKISADEFKYDIREGGNNQSAIWKSQDLPIIGVKKDGTKAISFVPATAIMNYGRRSSEAGRHPITLTGAYSTKRGIFGKLNSDAAREFVSDMLGLTEDQVIITNAVLKSFTNRRVFGVTQVSADIINNEARVQFILAKNANRGVYFHEAFHYVNLLLHTKEQRLNIYNTYRREHFLRKNWTDKQIEEALAEQCRRYCQMRTERGLLPSVRRLFSNFLDFAFLYRKTSLLRTTYDALLAGEYKDVQMDKESLLEFENQYNNATYMYIPNIRKDVTDNFKAIKTEYEFYRCAESLALCYTHFVLDPTVEGTMDKVGSSFERFLKDLEQRTMFDRSPYVQDILDNPVAFKYVILGVLQKYGIKGKTKSLKKYLQTLTAEKASENTEQREAEERYENTWDIDHFELSVKDNVAYRAKLFLSQIPNKRTEDDEFVSVIDDLLGLETFIPFDEVYNSVMKELSNCSTYTLIKTECARLGKTSDLFKSLSQQLEFISGDLELENQLASTIKKLTPLVAFGLLSELKKKSWLKDVQMLTESSASMDEVASKKPKILNDRDKRIDINNDNAVRSLQTTLRSWSQYAFASDLFVYSKEDKQYYVSDKIEDLLKIKNDITSVLKKKESSFSSEELQNAIIAVKENIIKLLSGLSIPFDQESLDAYLDILKQEVSRTEDLGLSVEDYNKGVLHDEFTALKAAFINKSGSGTISFILDLLKKAYNTDSTELTNKTWNEPRPFDTLFQRYTQYSQISQIARAYLTAHPSQSEHSVKVPGGRTIYPTNENNAISDRIRWTNEDYEGYVDKMLSLPYCKNSVILKLAKELRDTGKTKDMQFVLNLFVGMKDETENKDEDYFGITPMEDTISKMLMINGRYDPDEKEFKDGGMFVLPTMADKKTFYGIQLISRSYDSTGLLKRFQMPHDILTYDQNSEDGRIKARRFSKRTLDVFVGYFTDEIKSLELYYNRDNIRQLINDPNRLKNNYHGKVKNGRMDFSGNGGAFRYFYDILLQKDEAGRTYNLNQALEAAYLRLKAAEDPYSGEGVYWLREGDQELDGFELVRRKLQEIKDLYFDGEDATDRLYDDINEMLFRTVDDQMEKFANSDDIKLLNIAYTETAGHGTKKVYVPRAIPRQLLNQYKKAFKDSGLEYGANNPFLCDVYGNVGDLSLSVIGNYVVGQMMSIIEVEKLMTGDPSTFKYKYHKLKQDLFIDGQLVQSSILKEKDTDKIKRLGLDLSPGQEQRLDYSEEVLKKHPELRNKHYTSAVFKDMNSRSIYLNEMRYIVGSQILADFTRKNPQIVFGEEVISAEEKQKHVDRLYEDIDFYNEQINKLPDDIKENILNEVEKSISPYKVVKEVANAECLIRPALYRRVRIGLGLWKFKKIPIKYRDASGKLQTTYYSDEIAYNILETDGSWLSDPEKAAIVKNMEVYPLKMAYVQNDPHQISQNDSVAQDIHHKMAIFPAFKFMFNSKTGRLIYERMNLEDNEIDTIIFESGVKVGGDLNAFVPYEEGEPSFANMNDFLSTKSSHYIDKDGNEKTHDYADNVIPVSILNLENLRMLLNTEAHEDTERSLGTQMFKILFSNIYDNEDYCMGTDKQRSGKQIREDIMSCINAMTIQGLNNIKQQFYVKGGNSVDPSKVRSWVLKVLESNQVGANAEEIINNGGSVASLLSRKLIEQSMSALTNGEIVDILTNGGSAIQLSMFGFVSYDADTLREYLDKVDGYNTLNGGVDLKWLREDGSMEVMLSANFFRSIVPKKFLKTPDDMRRWLIDHDIIKGLKRVIDEEKVHLIQLLNTNIVDMNLSVRATTLLERLKFTTLNDIVLNEDKIKKACIKRGDRTTMKELREEVLEPLNLSFGMEVPTDVYSYVQNNPKPFGMGYRIPTQGLSSTFAFVVADIIPEVAGDVIIVPKEFVAQTGSDFDKIYVEVKFL